MKDRKRRLTTMTTAALLVIVIAAPLFASGCGASTPEKAVRDFMTAFNNQDFYAWLSTILPDNVRKMTEADARFWKQNAFGTVVFQVKTMTMDTKLSGASAATVTVTSGAIVIKNAMGNGQDVVLDVGKQQYTARDPNTGKITTTPFSDREKQIVAQLGTYRTNKYKGGWYVNYDLQRAGAGG